MAKIERWRFGTRTTTTVVVEAEVSHGWSRPHGGPDQWSISLRHPNKDGEPAHDHVLRLSDDEAAAFVAFYNRKRQEESSTPDPLLAALKGLIAASGHVSPLGGEASVAAVRRAGKYMAAVEAAEAAIAQAEKESSP